MFSYNAAFTERKHQKTLNDDEQTLVAIALEQLFKASGFRGAVGAGSPGPQYGIEVALHVAGKLHRYRAVIKLRIDRAVALHPLKTDAHDERPLWA